MRPPRRHRHRRSAPSGRCQAHVPAERRRRPPSAPILPTWRLWAACAMRRSIRPSPDTCGVVGHRMSDPRRKIEIRICHGRGGVGPCSAMPAISTNRHAASVDGRAVLRRRGVLPLPGCPAEGDGLLADTRGSNPSGTCAKHHRVYRNSRCVPGPDVRPHGGRMECRSCVCRSSTPHRRSATVRPKRSSSFHRSLYAGCRWELAPMASSMSDRLRAVNGVFSECAAASIASMLARS